MGLPRTITALTCVAALSATAACTAAEGAEIHSARGTAARVPAADPRPYARADAAFGLDLLGAWCRRDPKANIVLSPSSLAGGLGMVHLGARGDTAKAIARTLHLPSGDPLPGLHARTGALRAVGGKDVALRVTDQVWADKRVKTNGDYLDRVATAYDAGLKQLDIAGDPDAARRAVNDAVKKDTGGHIADLLPVNSVSRGTGWILTDAVYLKARWAQEFTRSGTAPSRFTTAAGATVQAPAMRRDATYGYARTGGWTAVDLPYTGGRLSMTALLPDASGTGCPSLSAGTLDRVTTALKPAMVGLTLPKADLKSRTEAKPLLTALGMGIAFSDKADLTGMSPQALQLQFVRHAATLRVDEKGTEAAAATAAGVAVLGAAPPRDKIEVAFDRPYLLIVRDTRTGEPLFLARVADPTRS
ncbi:serpin family protein [Actinomadura macrotermitis]|uniref:Serpin domain-containing protein n=1 Tax=Actinomadura macrotermitis TaxID=2585200 RepID=A0A7K0C829_9ACTN|nr:serpin family protein [Actinomadura macrotermitis]MQY09506.1 hypothetical protein [Actinomadura macrotermitis]